MDIHPLEILRRPIVTEKYTASQEMGKYAFEVHTSANKNQIAEAVEFAFHVKVRAVNTMMVRPTEKTLGRRTFKTKRWKKAIVTLQAGDRIDVFEGV
ncbi:MAG: 50S ribosomal protein L23 [Chloroflexi bacterium]|nr:50S ribosomal protein L23 [Chloroflexota bacterium]